MSPSMVEGWNKRSPSPDVERNRVIEEAAKWCDRQSEFYIGERDNQHITSNTRIREEGKAIAYASCADYLRKSPSPQVIPEGSETAKCECLGRKSVGANDPQDCNWPFCDCDPYANKVMAALEESGVELHLHRAGSAPAPLTPECPNCEQSPCRCPAPLTREKE